MNSNLTSHEFAKKIETVDDYDVWQYTVKLHNTVDGSECWTHTEIVKQESPSYYVSPITSKLIIQRAEQHYMFHISERENKNHLTPADSPLRSLNNIEEFLNNPKVEELMSHLKTFLERSINNE